MEHVTVVLNSSTTQILPHPDFIDIAHIQPQTFSIPYWNIHNITAAFGNNVIYLTPTFSVTLSDGLYTMESIN